MSYEKIIQQLKKQHVSPVNVLYGTESYFIQNIKSVFMRVVLGEDGDDNLSTYDLVEIPIQVVIVYAVSYPFYGDKKLIIDYHTTFLTAKSKILPFEHDLKQLEAYILNPVDYSILLFITPY